VAVAVTDDVPGVETASAYKNVVAIAVGIGEGLADRLGQSAVVHSFANARAAVFAQGLVDMGRLAEARGGRPSTLLGRGGAGDLFVTSLGDLALHDTLLGDEGLVMLRELFSAAVKDHHVVG